MTTTQQNDIPTKVLKENSDSFARYFHKNINLCIENSIFPMWLHLSKRNQRLQKITTDPLAFCLIYLKYQCGFRKGFNAQHCLVSMIGKWKESVDNGAGFGALMTDLSKAFDCLHHELLIAKLEAYGFDIKSVKSIQ